MSLGPGEPGRTRDRSPTESVLELLVLEGEDAGRRFTVDGPEVDLGRGKPRTARPGVILLRDPTVSSNQALIRSTQDGAWIEHRSGATNPTLVNGKEIQRERIAAGDRVQIGRLVLEVQKRRGIALTGLFRTSPEANREELPSPDPQQSTQAAEKTETWPRPQKEARSESPPNDTGAATQQRPCGDRDWHLTVVRGMPGWEEREFSVKPGTTTIGRASGNDVHLPESGVSRRHAELVCEGGELVLIHHSRVNPSFVNGVVVKDRTTVSDGDEIQLADRVVLRLAGGADTRMRRSDSPRPVLEQREDSLRDRMEEKIRRDRELEQEFGVTGSFLDIDVVGSYRMKVKSDRPEFIVVSFERFRLFVAGVVNEFDGQVLNSNGDELMCFFESPIKAVTSAREILKRLGGFNETENLMNSPFRIRAGVHTGASFLDRRHGVAYSAALDIAGHLQKAAEANGLLVSEDTLRALPDGLPFEPVGKLEEEGIPTHRLADPLA